MYRHLPAVDALVQTVTQQLNGHTPSHKLLVDAARQVLAEARQAITAGGSAPSQQQLAAAVMAQVDTLVQPSLRPVINASGVILQTNLGRAPLSAAALAAIQAVGAGYSNLEYDLEQGERGSRNVHLEGLLCRLTGGEAALAVNNNAAATYLVLLALAAGREVIISRGQAVEIGGGFRIPDVLRQSGASLIEVGTTNRTYIGDYEAAIGEHSALLMRIHTSNFRLTGFVHETTLAEMAALGQRHNVAVFDDLGSGTLLPTAPFGLTPEPTVPESIATGADLVAFSGDKLLGGPQAGLIVGKKTLVERLKRHPLARAMRVDKSTIAALEATLQAYLQGRAYQDIPVWQMISVDLAHVRQRAEQLAAAIGNDAHVVACETAVGGGSLPGDTLPSFAVALATPHPDALAKALRTGNPAVVARIHEGQLLLDMRTILADQVPLLVQAVQAALNKALPA